MNEYTINWRRSILIDREIDDDLVKRLMPTILALRQESNDPITVAIDSPGGSLSSLDILLGLLKGPTQQQKSGNIITVSTHRAYSAAANFLAFGNYAVALSHSKILFHDVRYGGMADVTPEKARDAARSLQDANDAFALRLANQVIKRLTWIYLDLQQGFDDVKERCPEVYSKYFSVFAHYERPADSYSGMDLAGFATSLWARLSRSNDVLIQKVMDRLGKWIHLTNFIKTVPAYRAKGDRTPRLLDGMRSMMKSFKGQLDRLDDVAEPMKMLMTLMVADLTWSDSDRLSFPQLLEKSAREFGILNSMNSPRHVTRASNIMLEHRHVFFDLEDDLDDMPEEERQILMARAAPNATLFWHFCVLLCRELFEGEHVLSPSDAQLLGLIDEVAGGGPVESPRAFFEGMEIKNKAD